MSGLRIAVIVIGVAITIPAFLTGAIMGQGLGFDRALAAFFGGGAVLAIIACFTGAVGAVSRLSTSMILHFSFGRQGAKYVNVLIACTMLGWYGVTAQLFGQAMQTMALNLWGASPPLWALIILGSVLMIGTTIFGFKALDKLSLAAVPLMALFLALMIFTALGETPLSVLRAITPRELPLGQAISAVAGTFMVGTVVLPDLCRYTRNANQAVLAAIVSFLIGFPAVLTAASIPGIATGEKDFILMLTMLGLGAPGFLLVVFATWTTNTNNLYSASLFFAPVFQKIEKWKLVVISGIAGSFIASVGMIEIFIPFLIFLGIAIPPIAGIYIADYFARGRRYDLAMLETGPLIKAQAFVVWAISFGVGFASVQEFIVLTGIPACDSILTAFILSEALRRIADRARA